MSLIRKGDIILIDIPSCVQGYHADQTRMYCLGPPPASAIDGHDRLTELADHPRYRLREADGS